MNPVVPTSLRVDGGLPGPQRRHLPGPQRGRSGAPRHRHEADRLTSLRSYHAIDCPPDPALDAIAAAAAGLVQAPVGLVTLLDADRQQVRASADRRTHVPDLPRDVSFCAYTILQDGAMVVPDARRDPRFAGNPLVVQGPKVRFYAGVPLVGRDGLPLGALCVLDTSARQVTAEQMQTLEGLAGAAVGLLELHRIDADRGLGAQNLRSDGTELRRGIDAGELVVHYQPVVTLPGQAVVGVEALVRWQHPQRGLLQPAAFLPVAEASGLVVPLGRHVLQQACRQVQAWRQTVPEARHLTLAVNLSGRQLDEPDVVQMVDAALAASGLPAQALTLELTETAQVTGAPAVDAALDRLRARGVALALDDFGTGYASLQHLQRFQPDIVKLDRGFVHGLGRSARDEVLVTALVDLALRLGCQVIAEGLERHDQVRAATRLGVRQAQGYLFAPAQPAAQLRRQLTGTDDRC